jgi:hypothetical protein
MPELPDLDSPTIVLRSPGRVVGGRAPGSFGDPQHLKVTDGRLAPSTEEVLRLSLLNFTKPRKRAVAVGAGIQSPPFATTRTKARAGSLALALTAVMSLASVGAAQVALAR